MLRSFPQSYLISFIFFYGFHYILPPPNINQPHCMVPMMNKSLHPPWLPVGCLIWTVQVINIYKCKHHHVSPPSYCNDESPTLFSCFHPSDVDRWNERGTHPPHVYHVYPQPFKVYYGAVSKFGHHKSHSLGHLIIIPCYPRFWDKPDKPSMKRYMIFRMFPQKSSKLLREVNDCVWKGLVPPLRIRAWSATAWIFSNGDGRSVIGVFHGTHIVNGHFRNLNWRYLPYIRPM